MERVSSSFRDPSGYVFRKGGHIYREVSPSYMPILWQIAESGLQGVLTEEKMLLPFRWVGETTIKPEEVPFISYPYEWPFSMLKDAALLTLQIQKLALERDFVLKDASAYNIQFVGGRPILIDHLSFYPYKEGEPWVAYRQFCQHFLNPLVLASYRDMGLLQLLKSNVDGIPANLVNKLLPLRARFNLGLLMHVGINSLDGRPGKIPSLSKSRLVSLLSSLESTVRHLNWKPTKGWKDYGKECNYSTEATNSKFGIVSNFLRRTSPKVVADLGANRGEFSGLAHNLGYDVLAIDSDPACVEFCYSTTGSRNILPLVVDLVNPSPSLGWESSERDSFLSRLKVDTAMCLALVHHLAIGNNLPLNRIAKLLSSICKELIIEWVPKEDSQVQQMLKFREDIFTDYTKESFEKEFSKYFVTIASEGIEGSLRGIYLMEAV